MATKFVNYVITNGSIAEQLKYSLSKLLDWRVGNAVCVSHDVENNYVSINDCPRTLRHKLMDEIGEGVFDYVVSIKGDVNISDVIRVVSEWVNEQK
jgi:hypothetical protein